MFTPITRAALGRNAKIGALYDVRTESFLHDSLFGSKLDDDAVDTMELGDTSVELVMSDKVQDKFDKLDIEGSLQVSVLAGLVKLNGSGAYLSEEKKSARLQCMSLIYKIRTVNEEFMLRQNRKKIDTTLLSACGDNGATHVVVGIDWGAVCSITCEDENTADEDETVVKGALKAELEMLKNCAVDVKGSAKVDKENRAQERQKRFTFKCKSDVSTTDNDLPTTFDGALSLAKSLPRIVKGTNGGKGVPVMYSLMPLESVVKMCKLQISLDLKCASIKEATIKRSAQVHEHITEAWQRLNDIRQDLHESRNYVPDSTLADIDEAVNDATLDMCKFTSKLQDLVIKVRREEKEVSALDKFLGESQEDLSLTVRSASRASQFKKHLNKAKLVKSWKMKGIIYIGKNDYPGLYGGGTEYVLYLPRGNSKQAEQTRDFFLRYHRGSSQFNEKFMVVDEAIRPDLWTGGQKTAAVKVIKDGRVTCPDLYEKEGKDSDMCLVRHQPSYIHFSDMPRKRAILKIRCPNSIAGSGECSGRPVIWKCSRCKQPIEYGMDTNLFYCGCGKSDPYKSMFRCNEDVHGIDYTGFPVEILRDEVSCLDALREKNILVLGETGVGKSTWINSIYNYLNFSDLDAARRAEEMMVLIPSEFKMTCDQGQIPIKVGKASATEVYEEGHSATQGATSYIFYVGDIKIRIIDTPGIGDTRGIEQDKANFDKILTYLSFYDEIHAICILFKPNDARLNIVFRFCIQELLMHLHKSAKRNIVFCFTNSRATFFKPGDTLTSLNKMLVDTKLDLKAVPNENCFCFDSESFRFLACLHNGVTFPEEDFKLYASSWERSVAETERLFTHVKKLIPHKVKSTIDMNEARRVVISMSRPLAMVSEAINDSLNKASSMKEELDSNTQGITNLKSKLKFKGFTLQQKDLPRPINVCANSSCTEYVTDEADHIRKPHYKQVCHDGCECSSAPYGKTGYWRQWWCKSMTWFNGCEYCGHNPSDHMKLRQKLEKTEQEFIRKDVQEEILAKATDRERLEAFKKAVDVQVAELQHEEMVIIQASAKFRSFLKENALLLYNDALGDYLDMAIEAEQEKNQSDKTHLNRLNRCRDQYEKEKRILDGKTSVDKVSPEHIIQIQLELFKLKHFGEALKDVVEANSVRRLTKDTKFQETIAPETHHFHSPVHYEEKPKKPGMLQRLINLFS